MSRFHLVEFRYAHQKRWHPWCRERGKAAAQSLARGLLHDGVSVSLSLRVRRLAEVRVVCIDTDVGTVTTHYTAYRTAGGTIDARRL